jgi:hypothetical protein
MSCNNIPGGFQPIFAFLSNVDTSSVTGGANVVTLDTLDIEFPLFQYLFYNTPGQNFYIAKSNVDYCIFNFNNLTLNGKPFSLLETFLSTYESVNFTNRNYLSPQTSISTVKDVLQYKNITRIVPYLTALTYSDLISNLIDSLVIEPQLNATAEVVLILSSKIFIPPLNLTININIPIATSIPGYANVYDGSGPKFVPVASKKVVKSNVYSLEEKIYEEEPVSGNFKIDKIVTLSIDSDNSYGGSDQDLDEVDVAW